MLYCKEFFPPPTKVRGFQNKETYDIGPSNSVWISGSVLAWMAAGDSAFVTICACNGTKTISLTGYAAGMSTSWFNWFLVQVNGSHA